MVIEIRHNDNHLNPPKVKFEDIPEMVPFAGFGVDKETALYMRVDHHLLCFSAGTNDATGKNFFIFEHYNPKVEIEVVYFPNMKLTFSEGA